jgi:hypothetical protein
MVSTKSVGQNFKLDLIRNKMVLFNDTNIELISLKFFEKN